GIAGQPVLTPVCNVVLLCADQFIILGTGSRVCSHIKSSLRIGHSHLACALDGIAVIVLCKCIQCCLSGCIALFRIQTDLLSGSNIVCVIPVIVISSLIQAEFIGIMSLSVSVKDLGT